MFNNQDKLFNYEGNFELAKNKDTVVNASIHGTNRDNKTMQGLIQDFLKGGGWGKVEYSSDDHIHPSLPCHGHFGHATCHMHNIMAKRNG